MPNDVNPERSIQVLRRQFRQILGDLLDDSPTEHRRKPETDGAEHAWLGHDDDTIEFLRAIRPHQRIQHHAGKSCLLLLNGLGVILRGGAPRTLRGDASTRPIRHDFTQLLVIDLENQIVQPVARFRIGPQLADDPAARSIGYQYLGPVRSHRLCPSL